MQEFDGGYNALDALGIQRSNDLVYDRLREAIVNGVFAPGQRLVETRLGERFGVSRAPVREAIRSLEREGLIRSVPRRGVFVAVMTGDDALEIYGLRMALECWAVRQACTTAVASDIERLTALVHEMEEASESHALDLLVDEDVAFHRGLCELSGNRRLLTTWLSAVGQIQLLSRHVIGSLYEDLREIPSRHDVIVEAIALRDPDRAEQLIRTHIESVATAIVATL